MKKLIIVIVCTGCIYFLGNLTHFPDILSTQTNPETRFGVMHFFLFNDEDAHFPVSSTCAGCHDADEEGIANVDAHGNDVNIYDQWQASIMAQSAKDPYWRAKVRHEKHTIPTHAAAIESKCTSCHAPAGHYQAILSGAGHYTLTDMQDDSLGLDGVSCGACHQISRENLGASFSGEITYDTNNVIYGPYPFPVEGPMRDFVGFTPKFSEHITTSETCAPCHTLATTVFDESGLPTENIFVEQATYHEWLNSDFAVQQVTCQSCHMPYIADSVVIASGYEGLEKRFPFALHTLSGANTMMLKMMQSFRDSLGIRVADSLFTKSIFSTQHLVRSAASLSLQDLILSGDSLIVPVRLTNHAGHKFPSGYPSRRAWLEIVLTMDNGDTLLHSGKITSEFALVQIDQPFERHHDTIRTDNQVQVYEGVMVDLQDRFTTVLDKGARYIKDNRIPPRGFRSGLTASDTTAIQGMAKTDANFNHIEATEGTGTDDLFIKIPNPGKQMLCNISLYYQSIPPEWLEELFAIEGYREIDRFRWMYDSIQPVPELVSRISDTIDAITVSNERFNVEQGRMKIYPNPVAPGQTLRIEGGELTDYKYFHVTLSNMKGETIFMRQFPGTTVRIPRDIEPGLHIIRIVNPAQVIHTSKIVILSSD